MRYALCSGGGVPIDAICSDTALQVGRSQLRYVYCYIRVFRRITKSWTLIIYVELVQQQQQQQHITHWQSERCSPSITFVTHTHTHTPDAPHNARWTSQRLSVCLCRWRRCTLLIMFTDKEKKVACLLAVQPTWNSCVFIVKQNTFSSFPLSRMLQWTPPVLLHCIAMQGVNMLPITRYRINRPLHS